MAKIRSLLGKVRNMTAKQQALLHGLTSVGIGGAVIALYLLGKLDATVTAGVLGSLGGIWSGVGGAITLGGSKVAATTSPVAQTATVAPSIPVSQLQPAAAPVAAVAGAPVAPVIGSAVPPTALGAEHGAPPAS
jgi:hypothetical protein